MGLRGDQLERCARHTRLAPRNEKMWRLGTTRSNVESREIFKSMNSILKSTLVIFSVGALSSSCAVTEAAYQGDCAARVFSTSNGKWALAKEVCFVNPKPDNFTLFLRAIGLSHRRTGPFSTQLWLDKNSLQREGEFVKIKFIQQATYEADATPAPDLQRIKSAKINCLTGEFLHKGNYKPIEKWKKPAIITTARGDYEDYSSPLNPYLFIKDNFCS